MRTLYGRATSFTRSCSATREIPQPLAWPIARLGVLSAIADARSRGSNFLSTPRDVDNDGALVPLSLPSGGAFDDIT